MSTYRNDALNDEDRQILETVEQTDAAREAAKKSLIDLMDVYVEESQTNHVVSTLAFVRSELSAALPGIVSKDKEIHDKAIHTLSIAWKTLGRYLEHRNIRDEKLQQFCGQLHTLYTTSRSSFDDQGKVIDTNFYQEAIRARMRQAEALFEEQFYASFDEELLATHLPPEFLKNLHAFRASFGPDAKVFEMKDDSLTASLRELRERSSVAFDMLWNLVIDTADELNGGMYSFDPNPKLEGSGKRFHEMRKIFEYVIKNERGNPFFDIIVVAFRKFGPKFQGVAGLISTVVFLGVFYGMEQSSGRLLLILLSAAFAGTGFGELGMESVYEEKVRELFAIMQELERAQARLEGNTEVVGTAVVESYIQLTRLRFRRVVDEIDFSELVKKKAGDVAGAALQIKSIRMLRGSNEAKEAQQVQQVQQVQEVQEVQEVQQVQQSAVQEPAVQEDLRVRVEAPGKRVPVRVAQVKGATDDIDLDEAEEQALTTQDTAPAAVLIIPETDTEKERR